jgi:hypothetical protein
MNLIMAAIHGLGYALDTPGALTRGVIAGRPGTRATGREMLESLGILGPNDPNKWELGDFAGFGADMLVDPLNLLGAGAIQKVLGVAGKAKAANASSQAMRAVGAMPAELVSKLHPSMLDEATGLPKRLYHGTPHVFDKYDLEKMDPNALFGRGIYTTDAPDIASTYAAKGATTVHPPLPIETVRSEFARRAQSLPGDQRQRVLEWLNSEPLVTGSRGFTESKGAVRKAKRDLGIDWTDMIPPSVPAPQNVRMQYLDVRNPYRIEGMADAPSIDALRQAGFDGIQHEGGQLIGSQPHNVTIAFDPAQVFSPYIAPALQHVPSANPLYAAAAAHNVLARGFGQRRQPQQQQPYPQYF